MALSPVENDTLGDIRNNLFNFIILFSFPERNLLPKMIVPWTWNYLSQKLHFLFFFRFENENNLVSGTCNEMPHHWVTNYLSFTKVQFYGRCTVHTHTVQTSYLLSSDVKIHFIYFVYPKCKQKFM